MVRGELKSVDTRTVHNKKVVRLTFDIPYHALDGDNIESQDKLRWLMSRVDSDISLCVAPITDGAQEGLDR